MQTSNDATERSAVAPSAAPARWVLEDPTRLVLSDRPGEVLAYVDGTHVATFVGQVSMQDLADDGFYGRLFDWSFLYWSHAGTLRRLQGAHCLDILKHAAILVRGTHSDIWHPRLHIADVRVIVPLENPKGLSPLEIFQLAVSLGF
jgi:hypothetical protein